MIDSLKDIRNKWDTERFIYRDLCHKIKKELSSTLMQHGVNCRITSREKELSSLIKKAMRKQYSNPYNQIHDKAGVRIVVHFPWQMERIDEVIFEIYDVIERDDKSESLAITELGYQAIHYTVKLIEKDCIEKDFIDKYCEIQLRTICQDVWSEMAHLLAYKAEIEIPDEILRHIHCLSALLEVGDKNFTKIDELIRELPGSYSNSLLNKLEKYYYRLTGFVYDRQLSLVTIEHLKDLYSEREIEAFNELLENFIDKNMEKINKIFSFNLEEQIFFSQPEIFIILERLEQDPYLLQKKWVSKFPLEELENIATTWGKPLS